MPLALEQLPVWTTEKHLLKTKQGPLAEPLTDLINNTMLVHLIFPSVEKEASVTPAFKKEDRQFKENYRPISVLNVFSKIFERFLLNQMLPFIDNLGPVHMIPGQLIASGQLTDPRVNFASVHGLKPVTVHMSFSLPRDNIERRLPVVQHWVTRLAYGTPFAQ